MEHSHDILKNELGAGVFPSGKHDANAAWLRIQVLTHNLLQLLKKAALPEGMLRQSPNACDLPFSPSLGR